MKITQAGLGITKLLFTARVHKTKWNEEIWIYWDVLFFQGSDRPANTLMRQATAQMRLPKHFPYHRDLLPFKDLVLWMKIADKTKYMQLCTVCITLLQC